MSDAEVLFEFAAEDAASASELQTLIKKLEGEVAEAETQSLLSGETDANNAICSIQSGAGGTDAQDFAQIPVDIDISIEADQSSNQVAGFSSSFFPRPFDPSAA